MLATNFSLTPLRPHFFFKPMMLGVAIVCCSIFETSAQTLSVTNGLQLWLRADAGITTNATGNVTAWSDQSGKANHAAQPDATLAPQFVPNAQNGRPAVRFDGNNDYLDVAPAPTLELAGDVASFFVVRFDDFATFRAVWAKTTRNLPSSTDYYVLPNSGVPRLYRGSGVSSDIGSADATVALRANTYLLVGFQASGTTITHYLAGQPTGGGQINASLADGGTPLRIGSRDDLVTKMKGDILELVIFDRALSDAERTAVTQYLQTKYGIQNLPPTVSLTAPNNNATVTAPANVTVTANAVDPDGAIARVDFFANGSLIATATTAPFRVPVRVASLGAVSFTATAFDNKDATATSGVVRITATGTANAALSVTNGLQLWLRADAGITKAPDNSVTAWSDQSGMKNDAAQADPAMAPKLVDSALNGKPVLRFDGTDDFLEVATSPSIEITGDIASFFVVKFDDFATFRAVWGKTRSNVPRPTDYYALPGSGIPRVYRGGDDPAVNLSVDGSRLPAATYVIAGFSHADTVMTHYLNGSASGIGTMKLVATDAGTPLRIGTRDDLVTRMKGDIAELLIFNRSVSSADQDSIAGYLGGKYGIPIVQSANTAPTLSLTAPTNGVTVSIPSTVNVLATAADADGAVAKVEFFANGGLFGGTNKAPFQAELKIATAGTVAITAVATDNLGARTTNGPVTITASGGAVSPLPQTARLQLWLRADAGVTTNAAGAVTGWTDFSGKFNNAAQPDAAAAPQWVAKSINDRPALHFDGVNDFLEVAHSPSLAILGDVTSFFVVRFEDFETFRGVWAKTDSNVPRPIDYYVLPNSGVPRAFRGSPSGNGAVDGGEPIPAGTYVVAGFDMSGTTLTHYLSGGTIPAFELRATGSGEITVAIADAGTPLRIGTRGDFVTRMKGDIAELIIYDLALSEPDRNKVASYLNSKYFVTSEPAGKFSAIRRQGANIVIEWIGNGILEEADAIQGPWRTVAGAASPFNVAPSNQRKFYRLRF